MQPSPNLPCLPLSLQAPAENAATRTAHSLAAAPSMADAAAVRSVAMAGGGKTAVRQSHRLEAAARQGGYRRGETWRTAVCVRGLANRRERGAVGGVRCCAHSGSPRRHMAAAWLGRWRWRRGDSRPSHPPARRRTHSDPRQLPQDVKREHPSRRGRRPLGHDERRELAAPSRHARTLRLLSPLKPEQAEQPTATTGVRRTPGKGGAAGWATVGTEVPAKGQQPHQTLANTATTAGDNAEVHNGRQSTRKGGSVAVSAATVAGTAREMRRLGRCHHVRNRHWRGRRGCRWGRSCCWRRCGDCNHHHRDSHGGSRQRAAGPNPPPIRIGGAAATAAAAAAAPPSPSARPPTTPCGSWRSRGCGVTPPSNGPRRAVWPPPHTRLGTQGASSG